MYIAFLIGRIIFGGFFISTGINHFKNVGSMAGYARAKGTPAPEAAVVGTGVLLVLGGLSMLLGAYPLIGIILLLIFLVGVSFQMHAFWKVADPQARAADQINFMKNLALIGALLMFLAIPVPWPLGW
ncbi:MAG TPA: DoxX family protein [Terriglobia bacterium]|nr:DoxX family protein [Terriglobia bacterium]